MQMSRFSGNTFSTSASLGASFDRRSTATSEGASAGSFERSGTNSVIAPVAVISRLSERRIAGSDETARILWRSTASPLRRRSSPAREASFCSLPWPWAAGVQPADSLAAFHKLYPGKSADIEQVISHDWSKDSYAGICERTAYKPGELARYWRRTG